jgi:integrase
VKLGGRTGKESQQTFDYKRDADKWIRDQRSDFDRGLDLDPQGPRTLFKVWANTWVATRNHRDRTERGVEKALRLHILPTFGDMPIGQIRKSHIEAWIKLLLAKDLAPITIRNGPYRTFHTIIQSALAEPLIVRDPTKGVDLPKVPKETVVPWTVEDIRALEARFTLADGPRGGRGLPERYRFAITLAAATGLRISEVFGLTLEESLPFPHREVRVVQQLCYTKGRPRHLGPPKTEHSYRTVPMPKPAIEALAQHLARFPARELEVDVLDRHGKWSREVRRFIFTTQKGTVVPADWFGEKVFNVAVQEAGVRVGTFHDLRHHFASLLVSKGKIKTAQTYLGHASIQTTLNDYSHLMPDEDEQARCIVEEAWAAGPPGGWDLVGTQGGS